VSITLLAVSLSIEEYSLARLPWIPSEQRIKQTGMLRLMGAVNEKHAKDYTL
jgi:hypothetical protein